MLRSSTSVSSMDRTRRRVGISRPPAQFLSDSLAAIASFSVHTTPYDSSQGVPEASSEVQITIAGEQLKLSPETQPRLDCKPVAVELNHAEDLNRSVKRKASKDDTLDASPQKRSRSEYDMTTASPLAVTLPSSAEFVKGQAAGSYYTQFPSPAAAWDVYVSRSQSALGNSKYCTLSNASSTPFSDNIQPSDMKDTSESLNKHVLSSPRSSTRTPLLHAPRPIRPIPLLRHSLPAPLLAQSHTSADTGAEVHATLPPSATPVQTKFPGILPYTPKKPKRIRKRAPPKGTPQLAMSNSAEEIVHVPRPPNAWILYRSRKLADLKNDPAIAGRLQADISKMVGQLWRNESPETKAQYEQLAEEKKLEHLRLHPEYRFSPQRKGMKSSVVPKSPSPCKGSKPSRRTTLQPPASDISVQSRPSLDQLISPIYHSSMDTPTDLYLTSDLLSHSPFISTEQQSLYSSPSLASIPSYHSRSGTSRGLVQPFTIPPNLTEPPLMIDPKLVADGDFLDPLALNANSSGSNDELSLLLKSMTGYQSTASRFSGKAVDCQESSTSSLSIFTHLPLSFGGLELDETATSTVPQYSLGTNGFQWFENSTQVETINAARPTAYGVNEMPSFMSSEALLPSDWPAETTTLQGQYTMPEHFFHTYDADSDLLYMSSSSTHDQWLTLPLGD